MSYQEKLIWGQFLPTVLFYGYYFVGVLQGRQQGGGLSLIGVVTGLAMIQVVFLILIAAIAKKEPRDERDRLIEYKAYKVAYLTAVCLIVLVFVLMMQGGDAFTDRRSAEMWLLGMWVGVEAVRMGTMLVLHRQWVSA
jgi:L-asparagine transporter-like permease